MKEQDIICIEESYIEKQVHHYLLHNDNKHAIIWETYRNLQFVVLDVDSDDTITVMDIHARELTLKVGTYIHIHTL